MDLIDTDFSAELGGKDKSRDKKKSGGGSYEGGGGPGSCEPAVRPEALGPPGGPPGCIKKEAPESVGTPSESVKEEVDETEPHEALTPHSSPRDEKTSPSQQSDKDVSSAMPNPSSCKGVKSENGDNADTSFRNDSCEGVLGLGLAGGEHEGVGTGGVPGTLAVSAGGGGNLGSTGSGGGGTKAQSSVSLDAQYMQQQSQIFVFSTALANKAAEAVLQGQYASIISYHCAQPRTKKYLEGSVGPQGPMMQNCGPPEGQGPGHGKPGPPGHPGTGSSLSHLGPGPGGANLLPPPSSLGDSHQQQPGQGGKPGPPGHSGPPPGSLLGPGPLDQMLPLTDLSQDMSIPPAQPLAGVKVPDENLTPQQRQHREEQLATLRKMHQILFPESLPEEGGGGAQPQVPCPPPLDENSLSENLEMNKTDWHKIQMQFYEDQKTRKGRANGPPPSYQQATRSASVPLALQSPNPSSPNNTTSNLSLPSPRTCGGGLNSPADKVGGSSRVLGPSPTLDSPNPAGSGGPGGRNPSSNPPTPVSSHLSPKHKDKLSTSNEFSPSSTVSAHNSQSPADSLYCRPLGQKPTTPGGKEPNLMPVPSPQQIQYLNAFEGQELTIQKQPNTSLKEPSVRKSPGLPTSSLEGVLPSNPAQKGTDLPSKINDSSAPSTPDVNRNFPTDLNSGETTPDTATGQPGRKVDPGFCNSPQTNDRCHMSMQTNFMQKFGEGPGNKLNSSNEKELGSGPNFQCIGPDNVPLNPNRISTTGPSKSSHFDPISSLAQMSQQLTNNVPNSPVGQPPMIPNLHQNMPQYNSPNSNQHMMMAEMHHMAGPPGGMQPQMQGHFNARPPCNSAVSPGMSVSPKMMQGYGPPQRPIPRGINYNGASIQVKPNAPNTIQYLPSRPQAANVPRGPPSLEFLRFSNPLTNLDSKLPSHNLQYFPNNYPQNNMGDMGMCSSPHGNMRGGMRGAAPPPPGMMRIQSPGMGFSNNPNDGFPNANCQFLSGPNKNQGPPLGGLAPDASQPLPPSMGQNNNFKNNTFIGPTTADPNYAQQFHNFQQQLYATNTRGQLNSQNMPGNQHYFIPK